ncbi:MAG: sugar phosphate isomerase/epimerase [Spirochaetia bacterium]|nr:TIM barrel protein [Spirochaetales bacterium]NCD06708.1 sugar phosphate isomerase/epimerase [Spirochaetia bacterium]
MSKISNEQLAVMSVQYVHYTLEYYLNSMKKNGIKNIDLWGGVPHYCALDYNGPEVNIELNNIKKKIDTLGMNISIYTPETLSYPYSISSPNKTTRLRTIEYFKRAIDDAKILNCDKVFMNSGCSPLDIFREEGWSRAIETTKEICDYAKNQNVTMVIEQLQPYESNLVVTLNDVKRFMDEVDNDALKVCIDVVAMAVSNENLDDYFTVLNKEKIALIHFADSNHYILGDGNLPLKKYIKILEKNDYTGLIDLEINDSIYWENPHESIEKSIQYFNELIN